MGRPVRSTTHLDELRRRGRGVILAGRAPCTLHAVACTGLQEQAAGAAHAGPGGPLKDLVWHPNATAALKDSAESELCHTCEPVQEEKKHALHRSGAFVHTAAYSMLLERGYDPEHEVPVLAAPFVQDPTKTPHIYGLPVQGQLHYVKPNLFASGIAKSQNLSHAKHRVIDIVATVRRADSAKMEMVLCVEVKSRDPLYVDWVFMRRNPRCEGLCAVGKTTACKGEPPLLRIGETLERRDQQVCIEEEMLSVEGLGEAYDVAVALTSDEKSGYAFQKSPVFDAANQVVEGTFGLLVNDLVRQVESGEGYDMVRYYLPVIVTSANLKVCDYDAADVSLSASDTSRINLRDVDSLVYEHPAPTAARFPAWDAQGSGGRGRRRGAKWQVIVVSAAGFDRLCGRLEHACRARVPEDFGRL